MKRISIYDIEKNVGQIEECEKERLTSNIIVWGITLHTCNHIHNMKKKQCKRIVKHNPTYNNLLASQSRSV
jgi:hypothetical protein